MIAGRAVTISGAGGTDVLGIDEFAVRDPGPGEVLVQIVCAGLNRADILQRRGFYPAPPGAPAHVPGLEFSGTVAAVGEGGTSWREGDRVMGIAAGGAMATHIVVHERELLAIPELFDLEHAAAIPEVFLTAYDALFARAELRVGEIVLLHAVGSGVGTAALQLALAAGARPIGTSRTQDKLDRCAELGLENPLLVTDKKFKARVKDMTDGAMANVILDTIGAAYLGENIASLATCGRLVIVGLLGGVSATAPLGLLLARRATVIGTVLRSRPLEEKATLVRAFSRDVLPLFELGRLSPVVDCVMPMQDIADAHQRMEQNETFGKIVLRW